MCGICGFTGEVLDKENVLKNMTDVIIHRGPNSEGFFSNEEISMGFRRLSIIDLNEGSQPIYNEDKTLILTFNGEIYNYKELKQELIAAGHVFYTDTDSEVLIHGFEEWQESLLDKLRGMFAFAIFNTVNNSLFLARDFFGIKPLHYTFVDNNFVYGSEIKSILQFPKVQKSFNKKALDNYLSFQYAVPPETFFEGIYCLLPGHYMWVKNGNFEITRYFDATFTPNENLLLDDVVEKIETVFEDSVKKHKVSDVEVGCFLSSGVDSSYVSTYFSGQKAFTVGFGNDEKYNEIGFAKKLAEKIGLNHYSKVISTEEFWDSISHVQYIMDQPLADPSCIALYFVSKLAREHVTVVLSGEGADELFGGYNIYHEPISLYKYQKIPHFLRRALANIVEAKLKMKRKITAFILAALMLAGTFISCGESENNTPETSAEAQTPETEAGSTDAEETEETAAPTAAEIRAQTPDDLPELDFEGLTATIGARAKNWFEGEMYAEELNGEAHSSFLPSSS